MRQAIEDAGASVRFLPAYSPDLNPIEPVFAKLKALLRAMALRTVDALWKALGSIIDCVSPQECLNFIRHAGYTPTPSESEHPACESARAGFDWTG